MSELEPFPVWVCGILTGEVDDDPQGPGREEGVTLLRDW